MFDEIKRPTIARRYRANVEDDRVLLSAAHEYTVLESSIAAALSPLLTGENTVESIVHQLSKRFPPAEIYFTLMQLEADGYIVDAEASTHNESTDFWQVFGRSPENVNALLGQRPVKIIPTDELPIEQFHQVLEKLGVRCDSEAERSVLISADYLNEDLPEILRAARSDNHPVLLIDPFSAVITIGPIIFPERSGCLACLQHRLALNRPAHGYLTEHGDAIPFLNSISFPQPISRIGFNLAALETAKWLSAEEPYVLESELIRFDLQNLETTRHPFVRRPQCPICGDPASARRKGRIRLTTGVRTSGRTNYRTRSAAATYSQFERHISSFTGVVRSLVRVDTGHDELLYNYTVGHSRRTRHHSIESLRLGTRDHSGGKGMSDSQARASGLCEALERFSAVYDSDAPDVYAAYADLKYRAIHPSELLLFSETQYAKREDWNARQSGHFQFVPEPYNEREPIDWTEAWSLTRDEPCLVPSSYCYYGYEGARAAYCKADSNGLAAGNTLEEAILQGFLELVERDAVAIWWYNRILRPAVDLASFRDPYLDAIEAHYHKLGRELWLLDLTHDLEIPIFVAISRAIGRDTEDILIGFGAHIDAKLAATRAVLEVNQSLPAVLRSRAERERQLLPDFADVLDWWDTATIAGHPYIAPSDRKELKRWGDYPMCDVIDLGEKIVELVRKAESVGLETLVLDLTRPDIELPVARVIVPGLRHFWRRLAPGRLYTIPVSSGSLVEAIPEKQLNPVSLFL